MEFCRFSDFKQDYPQLAEQLLKAKEKVGTHNVVVDKNYAYHLTRGMNVERQSLIENPNPYHQWHIPREASPNKVSWAKGINPHYHKDRLSRKGKQEKLGNCVKR